MFHHFKKYRVITCALALLALASVAAGQFLTTRPQSTSSKIRIEHAGLQREYRIHLPKNTEDKERLSLVICLHGGGGNAENFSAMGMSDVADRHGFIVVYPNAINGHWNDGRESERFVQHDRTIDDVSFLIAVVEEVIQKHNVDRTRVFATGMSNGGFMSQRLAMERADVFSGVGIIAASMAKPLKAKFEPSQPVSMLFMNGTEDKIVPYEGGEVQVNLFPKLNRFRNQATGSRGYCISTTDAIDLWKNRNAISTEPETKQIPDNSDSDGSSVELTLWQGGENETAIALYKVIGGGHAIPGRKTPALPERLVGRTNQDIDAFEKIWQFFDKFGRKHAANHLIDTRADRTLPWVTSEVALKPVDFVVFSSELVGSEVSYHIYKPPIYERAFSRRFPVLYWLHGTDGGVSGIRPLTRLFHDAMLDGSIPPMLVVYVNGLPKRLWSDSKDGSAPVESVFIEEVIPHVDKNYRTVAGRHGRIIEGFSMGDFGAARIGFKHADQFAGVSILAAGPLDPDFKGPRALRNAPLRDLIIKAVCSDDISYFKALNPWQVARENNEKLLKADVLIRQVVGKDDSSLADNKSFHEHLKQLKISHEFVVLPDVDHDTRDVLTELWRRDKDFYSRALEPSKE
ncbi:MAG: alpha/beta hydrolase-fold protein [Planctomycetota bacterium]|nr:alpha/beta hydrolase-fold protein [Planctomycetota bacterium]